MALSMKALFFTFSSGVTVGNTFDCTGFGFQPKAYLCFWNGRSEASDTVGLLDSQLGVGAAVSSSQRGAAAAFYDQGTTVCIGGSRIDNAAVVMTVDATGAITGAVDHDSFLSDGIRFIVDDQLAANLRVMVVAYGGSDITNVFLGSFLGDGSTNNENFTGLGFDPGTDSCIFFFGIPEHGGSSPPSNEEDIIAISFGAARTKTPIQQYVTCINSDDDSATMDTASYTRSGECIAAITPAGAASCSIRDAFVGPITDGFTIDHVENTPSTSNPFFALVIKGGSWHLGDLLTQINTTTDIVESGFGFQPRGALFVSQMAVQSTLDTPQGGAKLSVGACTGTGDEICLAFFDETGAANMETTAAIEHDAVYARISTSSAIEGLMQAISFPDATGFTMEMSDADPTSVFAWYVAAGDTPTPKSLVASPRSFQHMLVR